MISGILNINKPEGITSHDVVAIIRKLFKGSKVGHIGTLDPIATGVLPICIGKATRLSDEFTCDNKKYRVKLLLGIETDTYDITGRIVNAGVLNKDEIYIKERIKRYIGKQMQKPPIYSAIKVEGKKAYEYARNGEELDLPEREIEIYNIENIIITLEEKQISFDVSCSKGTYIRSLVFDIGKKLECGATMISLIRLKSGDFDIDDSIELNNFLKLEYNDMVKKIIKIEDCYKENSKILLEKEEYDKFLNGVLLEQDMQDKIVRIYVDNKFVGLGKVQDKVLKRFIIEE